MVSRRAVLYPTICNATPPASCDALTVRHEELFALRPGETQQGEALPLSLLSSVAASGFHLAGAHVCPLPCRAAFLAAVLAGVKETSGGDLQVLGTEFPAGGGWTGREKDHTSQQKWGSGPPATTKWQCLSQHFGIVAGTPWGRRDTGSSCPCPGSTGDPTFIRESCPEAETVLSSMIIKLKCSCG